PAMVEDRDAKYTHSITLSYTFYQIDLPPDEDVEQAALGTAPKQN
ncbi:MAG: cytochrome c oxidase assembly protein, partial [Pseudomonadota bacterium]